MTLCHKCNKNKSYPNDICRICSWEEWALYGIENWPQVDKDAYMEDMKNSLSYSGAVLGQVMLEDWIDLIDSCADKVNRFVEWCNETKKNLRRLV